MAGLILMSGLPGTGKSTVAKKIQKKLPKSVILQSDSLRKELFPEPTYSAEESQMLFTTLQAVTRSLIKTEHIVIFDATNLKPAFYEWVHDVETAGFFVEIVEVVCPEKVALQRIKQRKNSLSDATVEVYKMLRDSAEPITRPHTTVNTTTNYNQALTKLAQKLLKPKPQQRH